MIHTRSPTPLLIDLAYRKPQWLGKDHLALPSSQQNQFIVFIDVHHRISMETDDPRQCANCRKGIDEGRDLIEVREGVLGMRGFVPLEDELLFCSEKCLREHFDIGRDDLRKYPRRTP